MKFTDVVEGIVHLTTTTCAKRDPTKHTRIDFMAGGMEKAIVMVRPSEGAQVWYGPDDWVQISEKLTGWEDNIDLSLEDIRPTRIRIWESELEWLDAEKETPILDAQVAVESDFEWLGAVIDTMVKYHLDTGTRLHSLRYEFTWKNQRRKLEWSVSSNGGLSLQGLEFNRTNQTRFRGEGSAVKDLQKFLGKSWRFGGIKVSPLYPIARPKPFTGWGR